MVFLWRCTYFSRLSKIRAISQNPSSLLNLQRFWAGSYRCQKHFRTSIRRWGKNEIPSTLSKYELFSEETSPVILDVEEERQKVTLDDKVIDEFEGINLERGISGVFDIDEIVDLLKKEKAEDIFVVKIPPEHNYVDYMVIVSGRSMRHMLAISSFIRRLYKKKMTTSDLVPKLEGKESSTWMAVDLGNIVLHVFSKAGRELYDLETLWSVGKDYDSGTQWKSISSDLLASDLAKILAHLSPNV